MLFGHLLAAALAPGDLIGVEADSHHEMLVVVGAGFLLHHIAQPLLGVLLDDLLQAGLVIGLSVLALGDEGQDEALCHLHAAVQIQGGNDGLKGIGSITAAFALGPKALMPAA